MAALRLKYRFGVIAILSLSSTFGTCNVLRDDDCAKTPTDLAQFTILLSSGFCIYDLAVCVCQLNYTFSNQQHAEYLVHHLISLAGAALSLHLGAYNVSLAAACLLTEWSDLFMNARWFLLKHKRT